MVVIKIKWFLIMLLNLFGFLTAPIIFPIAYFLRDVKVVRNKILWIYFDDEDGFGYDVYWWMKDKPTNFLTAYRWCALRNPAWNLQALFILDKKTYYHSVKQKGLMQQDAKIIKDSYTNNCVLKYVNHFGEYMDNKGTHLSLKHSIIGKSYVIYYLGKNKYWKFSYANRLFQNLWCELQIGFLTRATFRLKFKLIKNIW
jgi:hypothetical protein